MQHQRNIVIPIPTRKMTYLPVGLILGAALAFGINSMAENTELDSGPRVFPYNGVLELDGTGFTGQADFQFTLTDDESCSYIESHDAVTVSGGRFSVNIGGVDSNANPLPVCVFDSEQMFIQIAVREGGDNQPHRALTGRQRIHPVPFAYWAAEGSDFKVDGDINMAGGNVVMNGGSVNMGDGTVNGVNAISGFNGDDITLSNDLNAAGRTITVPNIDGLSTLNSGGAAISTGGNFTVGAQLNVTGNIVDPNSAVTINDNLTVQGNISDGNSDLTINDSMIVTGNAAIRGNLFDNTGNLTIDDTVEVTGNIITSGGDIRSTSNDVTISDNLKVTGTLLRLAMQRSMPDNQGTFTTIDRDTNANGIQSMSLNDSFCYLSIVSDLNSDNSHRCSLRTTSLGVWQYSSNEGDCTVMCFSWN